MRQATVTKSIRLSDTEANELGALSKQTTISEAALMKKWVLEGIRAEKLERAIQAYMKGNADLRSGASMADMSYNRFMQEIQSRNIVILEEDGFLTRLDFLAEAYDVPALRDALSRMRSAG